MFKRDRYMYPTTVRNYHWKDLHIGNDIHIYGRTIHLYDCDSWTRVSTFGCSYFKAVLKRDFSLSHRLKNV